MLGKRAYSYLYRPNPDKTFGVKEKGGHHYIGSEHVIIYDNDIYTKEDGELFLGTDGLWELITSTDPKKNICRRGSCKLWLFNDKNQCFASW